MKYKIFCCVVILLSVFFLNLDFSFAQNQAVDDAINEIDSLQRKLGLTLEHNTNRTIGNFIKSFWGILGSISLAVFLYGGIMWMISEGDATKITKAKKTMIWAALGLLVIFTSYVIVEFLIDTLGEQDIVFQYISKYII